jgi:large repetitive protein
VVQASDGSLVMIAPDSLLEEEATISLKPLTQATLAVPQGFTALKSFRLELGDDPLLVPLQLALPNTTNLAVGTEVFVMEKGAIPDATGTWNPIWMPVESDLSISLCQRIRVQKS